MPKRGENIRKRKDGRWEGRYIKCYSSDTHRPKYASVYGKTYRGKELYDVLESYVRKGFFALDESERRAGKDIMWFIWSNENSPVYGKAKMATFERYFLTDHEVKSEKKNHYYKLINDENIVRKIFEESGLE